MGLDGDYDFKEAEKRILNYWRENNIFKFDEKSKKPIFSIDTPPPTVSGKMHLGHSFSYSHIDFVARYKRMKGFNVFFPFGTDDNGLATERMVEKLKNVRSKEMKREEFIELCLKTLSEIKPGFIQDWKEIGISADYDLFYSTINDYCRKISQKSFIDLYKKGLEYRKKAPIIFCPHCKTAIAQAELEDSERESTLNYIKAKTETGEYVIYATTRPELHPGCVGISIDKNGIYVVAELKDKNERWILSKNGIKNFQKDYAMKIIKEFKGKDLVGRKVEIPLAKNKYVEFSHDESAKTEYGSGVVYYCSYGGLDCVEWMARHPNIKPVLIMDETGTYTEEPVKGLYSNQARKKILDILEEKGALLRKEKITHVVNAHERCGTEIEYIATVQWFIKYLDKRNLFLKEGSKLKWNPKHMKVRYDNWIKGLNWDWCISRQRYFGIPFPVWYCKKCSEIILADEKSLPVDPLVDKPLKKCKCGSNEFIPEKDVLDTWATSSLTPQIASGLKPNLKLYPMNLRASAHDIVTTWLFYTLVKSQLHNKINPWKDIMISGHVLDSHGRKMSKSKGNAVEPQKVVGEYGADAFRFWAAGSKLGDDLSYQEKDIQTGKKTVTKLWNASKFISMHLKDFECKKPKKLEIMDKFILSKLAKAVKTSTESFDKYEYSKTKFEAENFFWNLFADYYLEIIKDRVYNPNIRGKEQRESAQYTLSICLLTIIKLFAPIMPFISEEIYLKLFSKSDDVKSIHLSKWPEFKKADIDSKAEKTGDRFLEIVKLARQFKSAENKSLKSEIDLVLDKKDKTILDNTIDDLRATVNARTIKYDKFSISFVD